jgi:hypothetical protein
MIPSITTVIAMEIMVLASTIVPFPPSTLSGFACDMMSGHE